MEIDGFGSEADLIKEQSDDTTQRRLTCPLPNTEDDAPEDNRQKGISPGRSQSSLSTNERYDKTRTDQSL